MLISALATDYDATLATEGRVADATVEALTRLKASGRRLVMVTGRELPDLRRVFPHIPLFDAIVAENGALLYPPPSGEEWLLADPAPPPLVEVLRARGVAPLAVGRSIISTGDENASMVDEAIAAMGLPWRTILNKNSVMCLPAGVDKASGLAAALETLGLSAGEVLGVGDAENDAVFLAACGVSAAVANALPDLKAAVDVVTPEPEGAGVAWLIDRLLEDASALVALAEERRASLASA